MDLKMFALLSSCGTGRKSYDDKQLEQGNIILKPFARLGVYSVDDETLCHDVATILCHIPGCGAVLNSVFEFEGHYNSKHRYRCSQCSKLLPSAHLLDLHLSEKHDSFFAVLSLRKPSYACYVETCLEKFKDEAERKEHCITEHKFPPNFRFDACAANRSIKTKQSKQMKKNAKQLDSHSGMNVDFDTDQTTSEVMECSDNKKTIANDVIKPAVIKSFNFGHQQNRAFAKQRFSKVLTKESGNTDRNVLEDNKMVVDLLESLS